jgi:hypothetical protein
MKILECKLDLVSLFCLKISKIGHFNKNKITHTMLTFN